MKLLIHTQEGTQEFDMADVQAMEIESDAGPLFHLRHHDPLQMLEISVISGPGVGLRLTPLSANTVRIQRDRE